MSGTCTHVLEGDALRHRRLDANHPRAFLVAVLALSLAALVASRVPARRAACVDPMETLRAE